MNEKKKLRQYLINILEALSDDDYKEQSSQIADILYKQPYWEQANVIGITISREHEVSTYEIIEKAWLNGKRIAVPRINKKTNTMNFYELSNFGELEETIFDLREPIVEKCLYVSPEMIDTLIVPGLAFDSRGYRLGFGGGYYDRYLPNYHGTTVALALPCQLIEKVPTEEHDMTIQHLITSNKVIR